MELSFKKNLGGNDRIIRGVLSIYLMITGLSFAGLPVWGHLVLAGLGVGLLLEAVIGY